MALIEDDDEPVCRGCREEVDEVCLDCGRCEECCQCEGGMLIDDEDDDLDDEEEDDDDDEDAIAK